MMKLFFLIAIILMSIGCANAQDVSDFFYVGPYEVYYKGDGDVQFRLKEGVDLYEYFGLKKDTVFIKSESDVSDSTPEYWKNAIQITLCGEAGTNRNVKNSLSCRFEGVLKHEVAENLYFNAGLSLGLSFSTINGANRNILECGIPMYLEICKLYRCESSLYLGIGITPTYYSITNKVGLLSRSDKKPYQGVFIAPGIDMGGYIPIANQIVKIGVIYRYKGIRTTSTFNPYAKGVGKSFIGVNIGIIF